MDTEPDILLSSVGADNQHSKIILLRNLPTFKLVGDNLDLYIRPRSETADYHAKSNHFFMPSHSAAPYSFYWIFPQRTWKMF